MLTKKDKGILNTFIKKQKLESNYILSFFEKLEDSTMTFIKKKDIILTKSFFIFKTLNNFKAVRLFDIKLNFLLVKDKILVIKKNKTVFFNSYLYLTNIYKTLIFLNLRNNLINYNFYINLILNKN